MSDVENPKTNGNGTENPAPKENGNGAAEKSITDPNPTNEAELAEALEKLDKQIEEHVTLFDDPGAPFEDKIRALIRIPQDLKHNLLNKERADRLFSSVPVEMYQRVFDPQHMEYKHCRPILVHILGFVCQSTSPEVNIKFKPLLDSILKAAHPRTAQGLFNGLIYNDIAIIVTIWVMQKGEGVFVYEALRVATGFFASQKEKLEVCEFLLATRILMNKIFMIAQLEPVEAVDKRGWPIAILSIMRKLLREKPEKFNKDMRVIVWDILSIMSRISGIDWFNMDKSFARLVVQLNHIEMQMCLHNPETIDPMAFAKHLRVLEMYTTSICNQDMFGEDGMEIVPQTVGDSTRFLLTFWVECYLKKIELHEQVNLAIFNFTVFLYMNEEMTITEDKVRKNIGYVMLDNAIRVLSSCSKGELRGDFGQIFSDILEKLADFEQLDDRVPLFMMRYLNKIRGCESYEDWKGRIIDCKCAVMDLRGRVDWYSVKSLAEAKEMLSDFTDPEAHEITRELFSIFKKLPRVN